MTETEGLRLVDLKKTWDRFMLEASFDVAAHERMAIVGRSGGGKSSLLRLIAGFEKADQGKIEIAGKDMTRYPVEKREIGFVFQDQALFSSMSVLENVAFGLKMRGLSRPEREERGRKWLDQVNLSKRANDSVEQLSGGERQRVALARALIIEPRLLLLDEPFTGLDPSLKKELIAQIVKFHEQRPVPLLMVTHDEADVALLATGQFSFREDGGVRRFSRAKVP